MRPNSLNHGTMFYKAIKDGLIDPKTSAQVGIRTWNSDFMGMNMLFAPWVNENGVDKTVKRIYETIGDNPVYSRLTLIASTRFCARHRHPRGRRLKLAHRAGHCAQTWAI
jgi:hypothetical protein